MLGHSGGPDATILVTCGLIGTRGGWLGRLWPLPAPAYGAAASAIYHPRSHVDPWCCRASAHNCGGDPPREPRIAASGSSLCALLKEGVVGVSMGLEPREIR